jgi:hypothetical protein
VRVVVWVSRPNTAPASSAATGLDVAAYRARWKLSPDHANSLDIKSLIGGNVRSINS